MANNAPIMIIHTGRFEGRFMPNNSPVRAAEPSSTVFFGFLSMYLLITHSKKTQDATLDRQTMTEPSPK